MRTTCDANGNMYLFGFAVRLRTISMANALLTDGSHITKTSPSPKRVLQWNIMSAEACLLQWLMMDKGSTAKDHHLDSSTTQCGVQPNTKTCIRVGNCYGLPSQWSKSFFLSRSDCSKICTKKIFGPI